MDRSQALTDWFDGEQRLLEDAKSSLVVTLAKIVADTTTAETKAVAASQQDWWGEARESLVNLFVTGTPEAEMIGGRESPRARQPLIGAAGASAAKETTSSALLLARLESMVQAEELRAADTAAAVVAERGPLQVAVKQNQRVLSKAAQRCTDVLEAACACPSRDENMAQTPVAEADRCLGKELDIFRSRLEAKALQIVAVSFEDEIRRMAIDAAAMAAGAVPPVATEETTSSPNDCSSELTRSQLDLRRAARLSAYAKALGDMLSRAREVLSKKTFEVSMVIATPAHFPLAALCQMMVALACLASDRLRCSLSAHIMLSLIKVFFATLASILRFQFFFVSKRFCLAGYFFSLSRLNRAGKLFMCDSST